MMYNLDEENIECALGNYGCLFLAGQESRELCVFISDMWDSRHLFVSDSWCCQIQRTID